jgi:hypothetical protein
METNFAKLLFGGDVTALRRAAKAQTMSDIPNENLRAALVRLTGLLSEQTIARAREVAAAPALTEIQWVAQLLSWEIEHERGLR